jgi:serpin B
MESHAAPAPAPTSSASAPPVADKPPAPIDDVGRSLAFAAKIYKTVVSTEKGNVMLSPTSLRLALGMVCVGARGETKAEMVKALDLDADERAAAEAAGEEIETWKARSKGEVTIAIASRLYGDKGTPFEKDYLATLGRGWGAPLEAVDFRGAAEAARGTINAWVKKQTQDKIPELFPKGSLNEQSRLVIANAVYFYGKWRLPFDPKATKPAPFFPRGGAKSIDVSTMHKTMKLAYAEVDRARLVELPYGDGAVGLVIALPIERDGLADVEDRLDGATLAAWSKKLDAQEMIDLWMPKFELRWGGAMNGTLGALGVKRALSPGAELSGITSDKGVGITAVFHRTYVRLDEKGTEAVAATGAGIGVTSLPPPPKVVKVDHPFLYFIRDKQSGRVLFIGRVIDPTAT